VSERTRDRFMPWAGLALGTLGAGFAHQIGAETTFQNCRLGSPATIIIAAVVGLGLVALGALGSWRVCGSEEAPVRRFVAIVGLMACAIYAVAIILPIIAALVIPGCWK
jgi:hypothetical protein